MIEICKFLYRKEDFQCPKCGFTSKHVRSVRRHINNKVCSKQKSKKITQISTIEQQYPAHINEYGVFICNCGKKYLYGKTGYILRHISTCPEFIAESDRREAK